MDLTFRPLDPTDEDLERFAACFAANGSPKDPKQLRWQYRANPVGRTYVDVAAEPGGRLGGIYAVFPVTFKVGAQRLVGVQSLDTLTDEHHRGKGLFTKLAKSVYDRCARDGVALVYGFPNDSSAHGFFERLAWSRLDPVPFLFLPLRARYFLRRARVPDALVRLAPDRLPTGSAGPALAADEEVAVAAGLDPSFDAVWDTFSDPVKVAVVRDTTYLKWRLSRPGGAYKTLVFRRAGEVRGYVVIAVHDKHGGRVGYVMELLHVPDDHRAGEALIAAATRELRDAGADVALAWCLDHSPNRSTYRAGGFRTLPERLRPIGLHFGVRALAAPADAALANRENWYLSYLDSDTV